MGTIYVEQIARLTEVIDRLAAELEAASRADVQLRRLCTIPGIGPVTAGAVAAFAPDLDTFDSKRNFAAWLGLVPRQRSTGGKTRLGSVKPRWPDRHPPPADRGRVAPKARVPRHERDPLGGSARVAARTAGSPLWWRANRRWSRPWRWPTRSPE
ncbi:transposase [Rhodobaculum claviforme]|uniref:transposase n=1 Tax=Rhodobaculum claviforme TaxID=1549854 RepID=UPI003B8475CD